jgi:hypothetical protein
MQINTCNTHLFSSNLAARPYPLLYQGKREKANRGKSYWILGFIKICFSSFVTSKVCVRIKRLKILSRYLKVFATLLKLVLLMKNFGRI